MRKIFCLDTARLRDFDNYQKTIAGLANDELTPGARPEILKRLAGCVLCSARETGADRLIYAILQEGPDAGSIVLCGVGDGHDYETILRRLHVRQTSKTYVEYPGANVAEGAGEEAGPVDELGYYKINPYHKHFITLDDHQEEALRVSLPANIYGAPGSGKTLVVAQMLFERALAFGKQEGVPPGILYLAPPGDLAATAKRHYEEACQAYIDAGGELPEAGFAPVTFENYTDFFKNYTVEGKATPKGKATGFLDFQAWYRSKIYLKKENAPLAEDCWAAFRICSLYSDVKDYIALGQDQCLIPRDRRKAVYAIFSDYKVSCDKDKIYSEWITPFSCEERFGFVVLDESQTRSGSAIKSYFDLAEEKKIVYIVGGHQVNIGEHASYYGRGADCATLLKVALHSEDIKFSSVNLLRSYRNPETVVDLLNYIIKQKKLSGLHSLVKGTDGQLQGNNGYAGEASFLYETEQARVEVLTERFAHSTDACVITSPDRVERVRQMWPGVAVLTPFQAMGLEFKHIICVDLLRGDENTLTNVCKILRAPFGIDSRAAIPLEPWFNGLIISISRAIEGVHVIEAKSHQLDDMFEMFKKVCGKNSAEETHPQKPKPLASSPEQWLELATRFLNSGVPDEALRLMNANVLDKTCPSYLVYMERHEAFLKESAAKSKPAMKLSPTESKKKKIKTPEVTIEAKQPEIQTKLAEPVVVNEPPVEESNASSAEEDEANLVPGKKKKKKKKKANEKKSCLVTLEPTMEQHSRVQVFALNFSEKGLQDIFDDEQALLLLLRIPLLQFVKFGNLVEWILSKPKCLERFFPLLVAQSPQFIAKFFNATDSYGRSGLTVLLVALAESKRSLAYAHNIFEKYPELYQLISHKIWYLKGVSDTHSWHQLCSPLQLFVCCSESGGVQILKDLLNYNPALFDASFVDLLTTKIKAEAVINGAIVRADLLLLYEFVSALEIKTANDFLMALVKKNKNIINEAFVQGFCETAESLVGVTGSAFFKLCCLNGDGSNDNDFRFINHLLNNSLASPKLEKCRGVIIKTMCTTNGEYSPFYNLAVNMRDNDENNHILKKFINQYVELFDPQLLGDALCSEVLLRTNAGLAQTNLLLILSRSKVGRETLSIILTKIPDVLSHIAFKATPEWSEAIRQAVLNFCKVGVGVLMVLLTHPDLLAQFGGLLRKEGLQLIHHIISQPKGMAVLKMLVTKLQTLGSEIREEDLFTSDGGGVYEKLSSYKEGFEVLDLIFNANPLLLKAKTLYDSMFNFRPHDASLKIRWSGGRTLAKPADYYCVSLLHRHCDRPEGRKILLRFLIANPLWSEALDVKLLFQEGGRILERFEVDNLPEDIEYPLHGLCTSEEGIAVLGKMLNQNPKLAKDIRAFLSVSDKTMFPLSLLRECKSGRDLLERYFPEVLKPTKIMQEALQKFGMYPSNTITEVLPVSLPEEEHMCSPEPR